MVSEEMKRIRREEFMSELRELFTKYNAEISAVDCYPGYPECGEDIRMTIDLDWHPEAGMDEIDLGDHWRPDDTTDN